MTGTLSIFLPNEYASIDPGSTLSYVTLFDCGKIGRNTRVNSQVSWGVHTSMSQLYSKCCDHVTLTNLTEMDMIDFNITMGMTWLAFC